MFKLKSVNLQVYIMLIAIAVIMAFFSVATDGAYLSARNISNLLRQTSITGILAIGMVLSLFLLKLTYLLVHLWAYWADCSYCRCLVGLPITCNYYCNNCSWFNFWYLEWLVGGLSQSAILHCYTCRLSRISWNFDWFD